jgi:hypothetical protein
LTLADWCRKELAHTAMHTGTEYAAGCRGRAEIEAESVAYILCQAAGLIAGTYSFGYVAQWAGGDAAQVKATAERVITTARSLLEDSGLVTSQTVATAVSVAA